MAADQPESFRGRLSVRQHRLLVALMTEPSVVAAAKKAGLCERHARKLLEKPSFRARYDQLRHESMALAFESAKSSLGVAVQTLREVASDPKQPASSRTAAASKLYDIGREAALEEIRDKAEEDRLVRIERARDELLALEKERDEERHAALPAAWRDDSDQSQR